MWNLQHIIFIGRWRYWQIFKSVCLYVCVCAHFVCIKALLIGKCLFYTSQLQSTSWTFGIAISSGQSGWYPNIFFFESRHFIYNHLRKTSNKSTKVDIHSLLMFYLPTISYWLCVFIYTNKTWLIDWLNCTVVASLTQLPLQPANDDSFKTRPTEGLWKKNFRHA